MGLLNSARNIVVALGVFGLVLSQSIADAADRDVRGTDVSDNNGTVNWKIGKDEGLIFGFVKATDGRHYSRVNYFLEQCPRMKADGVIRGAYHFYEPHDDPIEQADYFADVLKQAGGLEAGDLPPVLDIEKDGGLGHAITPKILKFLERLEERTKRVPMIYVSPGFADSYFNSSALAKYPLWVAEYGRSSPRVPRIWKDAGKDWTIWQYTARGSKPLVDRRPLDLDVFHGDENALKEFIRQSHIGANAKVAMSGTVVAPAKKTEPAKPPTKVVAKQPASAAGSTSTTKADVSAKAGTDASAKSGGAPASTLGPGEVVISYRGAAIRVGPDVSVERLEDIFKALRAAE